MTRHRSAREISAAITRGELKPQHIGPKSKEVLAQELASLKNEYKPDTMLKKELEAWEEQLAQKLLSAQSLSEADENYIQDYVDKFLNP